MLSALRLSVGIAGLSAHFRSQPRTSLLRRWLVEEDGQDLIEYALLCSAVGFAGAVAFSFISDAMNTTYTSWDDAVHDDALVEIPCPASDEPPC
jgi:Flp pilus assembly pilin Flp